MSLPLLGFLGVVALLLVLFAGIPTGLGMILVAIIGLSLTVGVGPMLQILGTVPYNTATNEAFIVLPLFLLMAEIAFNTGISQDMYFAIHRVMGHLPGGLAAASVAACAVFGAITTSSQATAVTIGTIALPEMKKYGYNPSLATGSIAAGGLLGAIVPPSGLLIIYGILTQTSIGILFVAAIVPALILTTVWAILIIVRCTLDPTLGPKGPSFTFREKMKAVVPSLPMFLLVAIVLVGLLTGKFTPTEAGGVGSFGATIIALAYRKLTWKIFRTALFSTGITTGVLFLLTTSALCFAPFITISQLPTIISGFISGLNISPILIMFVIILFYLALGFFLPSMTMLLITLPIFLGVYILLGFNLYWVGIIMLLVTEMGAITPPVAINVWIVYSITKEVPMATIFKGIFPFFYCACALIILVLFVPQIILWLPNLSH
jgi:C4-dicarboxylate transporter, DctM subunit